MEKIKFLILFGVLFVISCSSSKNESEPVTNPVNDGDGDDPPTEVVWETVFEDNFDDTQIDVTNWNVWEGGAFNNELQLYQSENLKVENGFLTIESKREMASGATNPFDPTPKDFEFTSARIESITQYSPSTPDNNGGVKFSARIKIGSGEGIWPAFWSYGNDWPTNGEIDVFEIRGGTPNKFQSNYFYGTTPNINLVTNGEKELIHSESLANNFHVYEVEWIKDQFTIFFDGEMVHTYTATSTNYIGEFYDKMQQVVFNGAVGGDFFTGLDPNDIPDNVIHTVDWIRVSRIQ